MRHITLSMMRYFASGCVYLKGLACKWKQPIDYFVTSSTPSGDLLKSLLLKCIKIVSKHACCLTVKAIICDKGSNNQSKLGASATFCAQQ